MNRFCKTDFPVLLIKNCIEVLKEIQSNDVHIKVTNSHKVDIIDIKGHFGKHLLSRDNIRNIININCEVLKHTQVTGLAD